MTTLRLHNTQQLRRQPLGFSIDGLRLPGQKRGPYAHSRQHPRGLTRREQQVLEHLARGRSNLDIASQTGTSLRTVEHHVSAVLRKLGVEDRQRAVARARKEGLVPLDGGDEGER